MSYALISNRITTNTLNTPFNNPKFKNTNKIKVVDPTHPLFGHSFHVLEWRNSAGKAGFAYVDYQHLTRLYIPLESTDLAFTSQFPTTKLTCDSIQTLVNLAKEVSSLWHVIQEKYGKNYQVTIKKK